MRLFIYILIWIGLSYQTVAQKHIEKSLETTSQTVEIYLDVIDNLIVESAKINVVRVILNDNEDLNNISLFNEKGKIIIRTDNPLPLQEKINKFCVDQPTTATYKVIVPNGRDVQININSGNLSINNFNGNLNISIETGFVNLYKVNGNVKIDIVDGAVVAKLESAAINVHSNLGKVVSELSLKGVQNTTNTFKGTYKSNQQKLIIKAIKANIYLEEVKD